MMAGTKYGLMPYRGPFSRSEATVLSSVEIPPRPAPT